MYENTAYGGAGGNPPPSNGIQFFAGLLALAITILITPWLWSHLGTAINPFIVEHYGGDWAGYVSGFLQGLLYPITWTFLKSSLALLFTTAIIWAATRLPMFA